jgi:hypothetical protein
MIEIRHQQSAIECLEALQSDAATASAICTRRPVCPEIDTPVNDFGESRLERFILSNVPRKPVVPMVFTLQNLVPVNIENSCGTHVFKLKRIEKVLGVVRLDQMVLTA